MLVMVTLSGGLFLCTAMKNTRSCQAIVQVKFNLQQPYQNKYNIDVYCKKLYHSSTYSPLHVLSSASVSDNAGNSPQLAAPRRSREIDQSAQRCHVGCDNQCLGYLATNFADYMDVDF